MVGLRDHHTVCVFSIESFEPFDPFSRKFVWTLYHWKILYIKMQVSVFCTQ